MKNKKVIIYKLTNLITNKIYIGITKYILKTRISKHVWDSRIPKTYLHKSIKKYGIENFKQEIIEEHYDYEYMRTREIYYIEFFKSLAPNGYNCTKGGQGQLGLKNFLGKKHTKENCEKIGRRSIGNKYALGIKRPQEQMKKLADFNRGRPKSSETRSKMSLAKGVPIRCLNDGKEFNSSREAGKYYNIDPGFVNRAAKGEVKNAKGYKFERLNRKPVK